MILLLLIAWLVQLYNPSQCTSVDSLGSRTLVAELAAELQSLAPQISHPHSVAKRAFQEASLLTGLPNPDDDDFAYCKQDFSVPCPVHWTPVSLAAPAQCRAPAFYNGDCSPEENFMDYTPLMKRSFALRCGVSWPCRNKPLDQDFDAPCPENWLLHGDRCEAPMDYDGECPRSARLRDLAPEYRQLWSERCKAPWPRSLTICPEGNSCPIAWTISTSGKSCVAPPSYAGPCGPIQLVEFFQRSRTVAATICNVAFDCNGEVSAAIVNESDCARDYESHVCPLGWTYEESSKHCVAGTNYSGSCAPRFPFTGYTSVMKKAIESVCGVRWPCKEDAKAAVSKKGILLSSAEPAADQYLPIDGGALANGPYSLALNGTGTAPTVNILKNAQSISPQEGPELEKTPQLRKHIESLKTFLQTALPPVSVANAVKRAIRELEKRKTDAEIAWDHGTDGDSKFGAGMRFVEKGSKLTGTETLNSLFKSKRNTSPEPNFRKSGLLSAGARLRNALRALREPRWIMNLIGFPSEALRNPEEDDIIDDFFASSDVHLSMRTDGFHLPEDAVFTDNCPRDYRKPCPVGWDEIKKANSETVFACVAPTFNLQWCSRVAITENMTIREKQFFEQKCQVRWPCLGCDHDYVRPQCPQGWRQRGKGVCEAPAWLQIDETAGCSRIVDFKYMVPELRREIALRCGYNWPCFQADCLRDFAEDCPVGWRRVLTSAAGKNSPSSSDDRLHYVNQPGNHNIPEHPLDWDELVERDKVGMAKSRRNGRLENEQIHCEPKADTFYNGRCTLPLKIPNTIHGRYSLETSCNVRWPCRKDVCRMNTVGCPYGYEKIKGVCVGNQPNRIPSSEKCPTQQKLYAERCHAPWACRAACEQDFTASCPKGWSVSRKTDRLKCRRPFLYKGACQLDSYDLTDATPARKWEFAYNCRVRWPCRGLFDSIKMLTASSS